MQICLNNIIETDLDTSCTVRITAAFKKVFPTKSSIEPFEVADIVGTASIPDIARYLVASGHAVQAMEFAVMCAYKAIDNCWSGMDRELLLRTLIYTENYVTFAKKSFSRNIKMLQSISDARAKTDTQHDSSATASAAANIARAVQELLSNSSEYTLAAIDDSLYSLESEKNYKEILSEIEAGLRKIIRTAGAGES